MSVRHRIAALIAVACLCLIAHPAGAYASGGWLPEPNKWVDEEKDLPITLEDGDVLHIKDVFYWAKGFTNDDKPPYDPKTIAPISISEGATATIIVEGEVFLRGAGASNDFFGRPRGASPAIEVPETSTLVIYSAHDEELAKTGGKPVDTLSLGGGAPAAGENGGAAKGTAFDVGSEAVNFDVVSGSGGAGGGGGAAAIGGRGGDGGLGGSGKKGSQTPEGAVRDGWWACWKNGELDHIAGDGNKETDGRDGDGGTSGKPGEGCGSVYLLGCLNVQAISAGQNALGGNGGASDGGGDDFDYDPGKTWERYAGPGGGGGGGGGLAAPVIGPGGAGGSGGGGGGTGASDDGSFLIAESEPYACPGGGGGGGGWPNGSGGGSGSSGNHIASYEREYIGYGTAGGVGTIDAGAEGGWGWMVNKWDPSNWTTFLCGHPGTGASGVDGMPGSCEKRAGGWNNITYERPLWGGQGGTGGAPAEATTWSSVQNGKRTLVLSTAGKYTFSQSEALGYSFGSGGGKGADKRVANTPYTVYDLADLEMDLAWASDSDYVYTGSALKPEVTFGGNASYSAATDRDGALSPGTTERNFTLGNLEGPLYGENIHAPEGAVGFTSGDVVPPGEVFAAASDPNGKAPVLVGSLSSKFPIGKATFTSVPITSTVAQDKVRVAEPIGLSLDAHEFKDGSGKLSELWLDAEGTVGAPEVAWSIVEGEGVFSTTEGLGTTFTPSTAGKVVIKASLSGMNDFGDYETTITFDKVQKGIATARVTFGTTEPSYGDEVAFTVTGVGEPVDVAVTDAGALKSFDPASGSGVLTCTDSGSLTVRATRPEGENWLAVSEDFSLAVKPRAIAATWSGIDTRPYDGSSSEVVAAFDDAVYLADASANKVQATVECGAAVLAGEHEATVVLSGEHADDYKVTNPSAAYLITIAEASQMHARVLGADGAEEIERAVYGDELVIEAIVVPAPGSHKPLARALSKTGVPDASYFTFVVGGVELKGDLSSVTQGADGSFAVRLALNTASQQLALGDNVIDVAFAGDANLPEASATVSVALDCRAVALQVVGDCTRPYDGTTAVTSSGEDDALAIELDGVLTGDDVLARASFAFVSAQAGTTEVAVSDVALVGEDAGWYELGACADVVDVTGIVAAPLAVAAGDATAIYEDQLPEVPLTVAGWVSDAEREALEPALRAAVEVRCAYRQGSDVGEYVLRPVLVGDGLPEGLANYKIELASGTLVVDRAQASARVEKQLLEGDLDVAGLAEAVTVVGRSGDELSGSFEWYLDEGMTRRLPREWRSDDIVSGYLELWWRFVPGDTNYEEATGCLSLECKEEGFQVSPDLDPVKREQANAARLAETGDRGFAAAGVLGALGMAVLILARLLAYRRQAQ